MADFSFEIVETIGTISEPGDKWKKELNIVRWNKDITRYDIRAWDSSHEKMGKGITLSLSELQQLKELLNIRFGYNDHAEEIETVSDISATLSRIKISDIVPHRYDDFVSYCSIVGKRFADEITANDYTAYRSQFGREKSDVKNISEIIGAELSAKADTIPYEPLTTANIIYESAVDTANEMSDDASVTQAEAESTDKHHVDSDDYEYTYADILGINASDYSAITLTEALEMQFNIHLSVRSLNALRRNDCFTLEELLLLTPKKLHQIRNLGDKSFKEIERALRIISQTEPNEPPKTDTADKKKALKPVVQAMLAGEQYSLNELNDSEKVLFAEFVEAADVLGKEFCLELVQGECHEYIQSIVDAFSAFQNKVIFEQGVLSAVKKALASWDPEIYLKKLTPFMRLYCAIKKKTFSPKFEELMKLDVTVEEYIEAVQIITEEATGYDSVFIEELKEFEKWMQNANIVNVCEKVFERNDPKSKRAFDVLFSRAGGKTLEGIAQQWSLTRERVRQLENKAFAYIRKRIIASGYNIYGLLSAYLNGNSIIFKDAVLEVMGTELGNVIWYCATRAENKNQSILDAEIVNYDKDHDAIVVFGSVATFNDIDNTQRLVKEFVESQPDLIETSVLKARIDTYASENELSPKMLTLMLDKQYKEAGIYSYRGYLSVIQMCDCVLKNRFRNGYKISDETDSSAFVEYLAEFFGEENRTTPRAIDAKIMEFGVLIDRGKYVHRDYIDVDKRILDEIWSFIEASPKSAITYTEIFVALERLFAGTPITNRYALQGIMKLYDCPYTSHKDYISKESNANVADELASFVKSAGILHKSEVFAKFPGWKDHNLMLVLLRCPEVISIDNGYLMHSCRLNISEDDRYNIKKYLDEHIQDIPISARYLQDEFINLFPDFMAKNNIQSHGILFGVLQYMFTGDYHFSRPFISKEKIKDISNKSVILRHLEGIDSVGTDDLIDICKLNAVIYLSPSYLYDMMQPEFIRINANTLMRFECIGIQEDMYAQISDIIADSVAEHRGYFAAAAVKDFSRYPKLNVPWTQFILESIASVHPCGINTIKMMSSSSEIPHSIFVCDNYADDDWCSLLVKILKSEHAIEPFTTKTAVHEWLQSEGLCNVKYPSFLETENHVFFDENGKLRIK